MADWLDQPSANRSRGVGKFVPKLGGKLVSLQALCGRFGSVSNSSALAVTKCVRRVMPSRASASIPHPAMLGMEIAVHPRTMTRISLKLIHRSWAIAHHLSYQT